MIDSSSFYAQPPFGICQIYSQVFSIFGAEWTTFIILSVLHIAAFTPIVVMFLVVAVSLFSAEMLMLMPLLQKGVGGNRLLLGAHLHRLLDQQSSSNDDFPFDDTMLSGGDNVDPMVTVTFGLTVVAFLIGWGVASICVSATFSGATIRAVAEIYAGQTPNWLVCIKAGWIKVCKLVGFGLMIFIIPCIVFITCMGILSLIGVQYGGFLLMMLIFSIACCVGSSVMIAGPSSIIIEGLSPIEAVKGSWNMCRSHICFIFCTIFCFSLLEYIVTSVVQSIILSGANSANRGSILLVFSLVLNIVTIPLNIIICPIIYFSLRIRNGLTQVELVQELSAASSIELASDTKYQHATNIENDDDDLFEKTPIALAHSV